MAKEDIDLWLILGDPKEARRYINDFDWRLAPGMPPPKYYVTNEGREFHFESMTDEDAVVVAMAMLREIEIPRVQNEEACYLRWTH